MENDIFDKCCNEICKNRFWCFYPLNQYKCDNLELENLIVKLNEIGINCFFEVHQYKDYINRKHQELIVDTIRLWDEYIQKIEKDRNIAKESYKNYCNTHSLYDLMSNAYKIAKEYIAKEDINEVTEKLNRIEIKNKQKKTKELQTNRLNINKNVINKIQDIPLIGYIPKSSIKCSEKQKLCGQLYLLVSPEKKIIQYTDVLFQNCFHIPFNYFQIDNIDDACEFVEDKIFIFHLEYCETLEGFYFKTIIDDRLILSDLENYSIPNILDRYSYKCIDIDDKWDDYSIKYDDESSNYFIYLKNSDTPTYKINYFPNGQYIYISKKIFKYVFVEKSILEMDIEEMIEKNILTEINELLIEIDELEDKNSNMEENYEANSKVAEKIKQRKEVSINKPMENQNLEIVNRMLSLCEQQNLFYRKEDLFMFHVSMKVNNMTILSGISGTGKSRLVHLYKQALGLSEEQLKFIPVRPFWQDDSDLIGYVDMKNNIYHPGDSGLIDVLIEASKNVDKLYLICFDELNIARVEHYFSQFLSVLEISNPNERYIQLYNDNLYGKLYNSGTYPSKVLIGNNVLFVGTINTDESTFTLSDKVLDRINTINLSVIPFNRIEFYTSKNQEVSQKKVISSEEYYEDEVHDVLNKDMKEFLWELHNVLQQVDYHFGVGIRTLKQINDYLSIAEANDIMSIDELFDYQLCQKIFTKLRGTESQLSEVICEDGKIIKLFNKYRNLSKFDNSKKLLEQKYKELEENGYVC